MFANAAFESVTGYSLREIYGRFLFHFALDSVQGEAWHSEFVLAASGKVRQHEVVIKHKNGSNVYLQLKEIPAWGGGEIIGVHCVALDKTEQRLLELRLQRFSQHDDLTGLYNSVEFEDLLRRELSVSERFNTHGAVLVVHFHGGLTSTQPFNQGDQEQYIAHVAKALQSQLEDRCVFARTGTHELSILIGSLNQDDPGEFAEEVLGMISKLDGSATQSTMSIGCHIGLALYPEHGITVEELLPRARLARHHAEQLGDNQYAVYREMGGLSAEAISDLKPKLRLHDMISNRDLLLYAQPIHNLRTGSSAFFEVLLRLRKGTRVIPPSDFIRQAERLGVIDHLDRWVISEAAKWLEGTSKGRYADTRIAVNISGKSFANSAFVSHIKERLSETGVAPSRLILEITETHVISDLDMARRIMEEVIDFGCTFSLDDFGSGYSSFNYLRFLPVEYVKVDGGFVRGMSTSVTDRELIKLIVSISKALGKKTVAEHVENESTLRALADIGVDYVQGYFLGWPERLANV